MQQVISPRGRPQCNAHQPKSDKGEKNEGPTARTRAERGRNCLRANKSRTNRKPREKRRGNERASSVHKLSLPVGNTGGDNRGRP